MDVEFDPSKDEANITKHGVSLAAAKLFDWSTAMIVLDQRVDYGEARFSAIGMIGKREYVVIFTYRVEKIRAISVRKANEKERRRYEQNLSRHRRGR